MILTFILDNQLENAKTAKSILPKFHLVTHRIGKILFTLSHVKYKQFNKLKSVFHASVLLLIVNP